MAISEYAMSIIQSLWIGSILPPLQQLSIRSFLAQGHEYRLYTYGAVDGVPAGAECCDGSAILPRDSIFCYQNGYGKGSFSAFSNLFRYKLILERGGWWVDTDVICLKTFTFDDPFVFGTEIDIDGSIFCSSCVFRCPAGAQLLGYCVDVALSKDKSTLQWGQIGPQLFSDAVKRYDLAAHCVPTETFNPIHYFNYRSMIEPGFDMSRVARSYAVHFWNQKWKSSDLEPAVAAANDSLYGILCAKYASSTNELGLS